MLNSSIARFIVRSYIVETQISTHVLQNILITKFNPKDKIHQKLAGFSASAHITKDEGDEQSITVIEKHIDELAAQLWGLTKEELEEIQESLKELK